MALRADDVDLGRDRALVEHFQHGDQVAFEDLYTRYFGRVYRFCLRRVGDRHEAEELAQEAFARAYRALPSLDGERRFYPWITVIASRLCIDSHRRRARTEPSDTIDLGTVEGGQERIVDAADAELVNLAFGRLATSHREVLKLREHEEWSYQHIADHLGVTLGTVEARLFRARQALRREFAAVAGPDSGLAAVPVLGWLLRRLVGLRHRAADLAAAGNLAPAIGGALAAVAVVVGTTFAASTAPHGSSASPGAHVIVPASVTGPAGSTTGAPSEAPVTWAGEAASTPTAGPGRRAPGVYVSPGMEANPATVDHDAAAQQADTSSISQSVAAPVAGKVHIGVDPATVVNDATHDAADAQSSVTQSSGGSGR